VSRLNTKTNLQHFDDLYQALVDLHDGLTDSESQKVNAKLILLLANQIGDSAIVLEAITAVKNNSDSPQVV